MQFKIRSYEVRSEWKTLQQGSPPRSGLMKRQVLGFYNSSQHLFFDPQADPVAHSHEQSWHWLPYQEYCGPVHLPIGQRAYGSGFPRKETVPFCYLGHALDLSVTIQIGNWRHQHNILNTQKYPIPPRHILYVSVHFGVVMGSLLVEQPIPFQMLRYVMWFNRWRE